MLEALEYPFFQRALIAGLLASVACGVVGTYVVVKRMASISGGLSHAAFGGLGLGHLLGVSPMAGAAVFAVASGLGIGVMQQRLRTGVDTLIAMVWSVGMALGMLFISLAPGYVPDLTSYLFGSILFVPEGYLAFVGMLDVVVVCAVALFRKELLAVAFDEDHARVAGVPVTFVRQLLYLLTSLAVVTLIRVVGVILVIALLSIPASIARQWARSINGMMLIATLVGAFCCTAGLFAAYALSDVQVPTGPLIILIAAVLYGISSAVRMLGRR